MQLNVRKRQGWGSTITRHERRLITARHVVEGINPLPSEGPTPWPNDPAYDWQLGDPLPNYPGAVYHPDRRLRTTGHYPNMRMLPAGSASYLYINRLSRDCVYAEIHEPVNGAQRRILSRQIRASCRLARALGAVAIVDPKFRPTWSAWPRSPGDPPSLAAWKVELRRAQGYAVASHHQQRNPISAHVKREARAHFEAAGRICGLCLRPVEMFTRSTSTTSSRGGPEAMIRQQTFGLFTLTAIVTGRAAPGALEDLVFEESWRLTGRWVRREHAPLS